MHKTKWAWERLIKKHQRVLVRKGCHNPKALIYSIRCDLINCVQAAIEVVSLDAADVINNFFCGVSDIHKSIAASCEFSSIEHVGFEVMEPMDLVVEGVQHWVETINLNIAEPIIISRISRFSASEEFQRRVGGYAEIMRVWLEFYGVTLFLELFDIYRQPALQSQSHEYSGRQFNIRHYAFSVKNKETVDRIHRMLQDTAQAHGNIIEMPYAKTIFNSGDNSYNTKAINRLNGCELEFVYTK